ncbi:MAG: exo-alpha-sialidase [Phycisphaeraceae bacterium]|nr:exo-alpha-sialidase [Phycisphaeraceae bacterium]
MNPKIITIRKATAEFPRHSEATAVELTDGSLLLVWQEYTASNLAGHDNAPNQLSAILSRDGGLTWGDHRVLVETQPGNCNVYSPSLAKTAEGEILFTYFTYHVLEQGKTSPTTAYLSRSRDEGRTFSPPEVIWDHQPLTCCAGSLVVLDRGRLILPNMQKAGETWTPSEHMQAGSFVSDDAGRTWRQSNWVKLPMRGCMEPHVAELRDGRLMMAMRTQLGSVFACSSADAGLTWSKPQTTGLHAPESCPDLVRIPSTGDLVMVWNNSEYDPTFRSHYGKRSPLTVAVSRDQGRSWGEPKNIEVDPAWAYSNPDLQFFGDGQAILTYWSCPYRQDWRMNVDLIDLKAAIFDVDWLYL